MSAHRSTRLLVLAAAFATSAAFAAAPAPNIENGKNTFELQCGICHSADAAVNTDLAPNLAGVVGRKAGTNKDFRNYTAAMKAYGVVWSAKTLDEFLVNPMAKVPNTTMIGILPEAKTRADVIAYLATLKK